MATPSRETLRALPALARRREVRAFIRSSLKEILGQDEVAEITRETRLFDLGVGSLLIVELRHRLEALTGGELPISLFMSHASLEVLTNEVVERLGEEAETEPNETKPDDPGEPPER